MKSVSNGQCRSEASGADHETGGAISLKSREQCDSLAKDLKLL